MHRWEIADQDLTPLPVDDRWQEIFIRWARKNVDFTVAPAKLPDV